MRLDRRLVAILLGASLLANLFLGGMIIGGELGPRPAAGAGAFAPRRQVQRLTPDERARFVQAMAPYRSDLRASRQAVRRARAQVELDIGASAYDRIKVAADLAALRQATAAQQALMHGALTDALGRLSPASRQFLVTRAGRVGNAADPR